MKKVILRYFLEFCVIIMGISISFYIEKQNALDYKKKLKNQSLNKLIININQDLGDSNFNFKQHLKASLAGQIILERGEELHKTNKDSLGYYLTVAAIINTALVDNQEEYNALKNSGLIELIDNDTLVSYLQAKYSRHNFYKTLESIITDLSNKASNIVYDKVTLKNKKKLEGQPIYWSPYKQNSSYLSIKDINLIYHKRGFHEYYAKAIKLSIEKDSIIILKLKKEINSD